MPIALDRADRKLLIGAIVLMIVLVATSAVLAPPEPAPAPMGSSYSPGPTGAKAAYLLLGETGYSVERWAQPLTELPDSESDTVLILSEPIPQLAGKADRDRLSQFIRRGGRLVFAGTQGSTFLPLAFSALLKPLDAVTRTYSAVAVSPLTRGAPSVTMSATVKWNGYVPNGIPLYANKSDAVVVTYEIGKGQVIWWASATPLCNDEIGLPGNLNLLLNSLGPLEGKRILWDEYYHGERRSLSSYLAGTPVTWMLAQAGLIYLVLLLAYGRRTGPIRAPVVESRLSPLEFVETLGALYQTAGAASGAVEAVWQRFRYMVGTRLGLPASASVRQIFESARERLGWSEPGLFEALQKAERAAKDPDLSDSDALQIVDSLEHYAGLLELNRTGTEEKRTWRSR